MKNFIYFNKTLLIIFIIFFSNIGESKDCDNYYLFNFGLKPFCELSDGNPISFGSLNDVKNAYIQCENGYYQKENISQQILECYNQDGEWSDELITCSPICVESPKELELIDDKNEKFPPWYVEVIRKSPIQGEINKIPAMIFFEREVVTLRNYVGNFQYSSEFVSEFLIRVYDTKSSYKDFKISNIDCASSSMELNIYCVIQIPYNQYIKFNKNNKPVCTDNSKFDPGFFNYFKIRRNKRLPKYVGPCILPSISDPKVEMVCFKTKYESVNGKLTNIDMPIDCREEASQVIIRCRIGYQYKKPVSLDRLSSCVLNNWYYEPDNGCDLICGKNEIQSITARIFEGNDIDITSVPWHVGIFANHTDFSNTYEQICGGTIIHSNIVISAAHCFYDETNFNIYDESNYIVGAGKNLRDYSAIEENSNYIRIKKIHVTENYQSTEFLNDIAILILAEHLKLSEYIKPVCIDFTLYNDYSIKNGIKGYITGWGSASQFGTSNNNLLTTTLTTITNTECIQLLHPRLRSQIIGDKFCAINEKNSTACQGDSGGGFIVKQNIGQGDRYYLTGIISTGIDRTKYCSNGFLSTFTNIQFYQNFIKDIISAERKF